MKKLIKRYQIGGYVQPQNVQEAISNGSASAGLLQGFGKVMEKFLPTWIQKAGTYVSPLNYAAAISKGSINPKVGEEVISTWHPNLQLVTRLGETIGGGKVIKSTGNAAINTAAKAGNKTARAYIISKKINKAIKNAINQKELSNQFIEQYVTNPKGSGKVIHYDNGDAKSVFRNSGASIKDGKLVPGQTTRQNQANFTWWNKDNPYLNVHKSQGQFSPSRYIIVDQSSQFVHPLKAGKSVGQSDGAGRGFILPTEVVSEASVDLSNASIIQKNPFGWWERIKVQQPSKVTNKYNREPVTIWNSALEYPEEVNYIDYVKRRGKRLKEIAPDRIQDYTPNPNNPLDQFMKEQEDFNPMYKMTPGANLKAHLNENIRRLKIIYGNSLTDDIVQDMRAHGQAPYYLGYFNHPGTSGLHNVQRNLNMIELNPHSKLHSDMMHEGIMHGTDGFQTDYTASLYQDFIDKMINSPEVIQRNGQNHYKWIGINTRPVLTGGDRWYEARSTFGELRKRMYDNIAKEKGTRVTEDTFEQLRPEFERQVDNMTTEQASRELKDTNPYGEMYGIVGPKVNPNFLSEFKNLLKYAPITMPFLYNFDKKKKGGKLCLIKRKN